VIKDRVAVIVFNNKEAEKLAADIVGGGGSEKLEGIPEHKVVGTKEQMDPKCNSRKTRRQRISKRLLSSQKL
jgi:hypothetical protein